MSNGEDEWTSDWDVPKMPQEPQTGETGRQARGLRVGAVLLVALLVVALSASLTVFFTPIAGPIITHYLATTPTIASSVATQEAALTQTSADWYLFISWEGGFQVDVPGVIQSSHGYFINDFNGMGADLSYSGAPVSSPLQRREAHLEVSILYSTKITDRNICPQGGVAVMIGSGNKKVPAWVRNEGRIVALNLVLNGRAIQITLDSQDDAQSALARYGDIWRHMLASFAPLAGAPRLSTHPCG